MSRGLSAQQQPPSGLAEFPQARIEEGTSLFRSTAGHPPGWFSSGGGRFDLSHPDGTLYAARSIHAAAMERIAAPAPALTAAGAGAGARVRNAAPLLDKGAVPEEAAQKIIIHELTATAAFDMADLTNPVAATHFGVTGELSGGGGPDVYKTAGDWAQALFTAGHGGIEYRSRFVSSTQPDDNAVAVFGSAGAGLGPLEQGQKWALTEVAAEAGISIRPPANVVPPPEVVPL